MRWPSAFIASASVALFGTILSAGGVMSSFISRGAPPPLADASHASRGTRSRAGMAAGAYVGSASCQGCHESEYASWRKTLHVQMTRPIGEATVVGDFRPGTHLEQYGRAYKMETHDGRYFISVSRGA